MKILGIVILTVLAFVGGSYLSFELMLTMSDDSQEQKVSEMLRESNKRRVKSLYCGGGMALLTLVGGYVVASKVDKKKA